MATPANPPAWTPEEHRAVVMAATTEHAQRVLNAGAWVVACLYMRDGQPAVAGANVYTGLSDALGAYGTLRASAAPHERITLTPVRPITETELRAAGLIDAA